MAASCSHERKRCLEHARSAERCTWLRRGATALTEWYIERMIDWKRMEGRGGAESENGRTAHGRFSTLENGGAQSKMSRQRHASACLLVLRFPVSACIGYASSKFEGMTLSDCYNEISLSSKSREVRRLLQLIDTRAPPKAGEAVYSTITNRRRSGSLNSSDIPELRDFR